MGALVNLSIPTVWTPPPFTVLNTSAGNCDQITDFLADQLMAVADDEDGHRTSIGDYGKIVHFLYSIIPQDWSGGQPTLDQLLLWFHHAWLNETYSAIDPDFDPFLDQIGYLGFFECDQQICDKMGVEGDPDVSGRGMMGSYYLAAGLSTVYFFILFLGPAFVKSKKSPRFLEAFRETVNIFLDAALIFSGAMLASTVVRVANVLRRRFLRQILWLVVVALFFAVMCQYATAKDDRILASLRSMEDTLPKFDFRTDRYYRELIWLDACTNPEELYRLDYSIYATRIILVLNLLWLIHYLIGGMVLVRRFLRARYEVFETPRLWKAHGAKLLMWWDRLRPVLRYANAVLCCALMWATLVLFVQYRESVHQKAPTTDKDSEWSFGQVLALATWVPVIVEWVAIMFYGPVHVLGEHMAATVAKANGEDTADESDHSMDMEDHGSSPGGYAAV
ncbi:hypothetical protein F4778DRAFT_785914 [Xylariomycetidae sp. FL2044]|nr:hypothetical protein F4778DRAFT_785914 [Xylariomycetidae sp. FL2044]